MEALYLDVLGLINFAVDFLLLAAAKRLSGSGARLHRILMAAALGGVYGCVCVLPGWRFLSGIVWRLIFLMLMGGIAFGFCISGLRRCALFVLLSMAVGGAVISFGSSVFLILSAAVSVCMMCIFGLRGKIGARYLPVSVFWRGKHYRFQALRDTGNTLRDPITGDDVMVVSSAVGEKLLGVSAQAFRTPASLLTRVPGGRLIPYHTVGTDAGMLFVKCFENVTIGKRKGRCLLAFAPCEIGSGEEYEALTGGFEWD